jgi:hypothetical protein
MCRRGTISRYGSSSKVGSNVTLSGTLTVPVT